METELCFFFLMFYVNLKFSSLLLLCKIFAVLPSLLLKISQLFPINNFWRIGSAYEEIQNTSRRPQTTVLTKEFYFRNLQAVEY